MGPKPSQVKDFLAGFLKLLHSAPQLLYLDLSFHSSLHLQLYSSLHGS